MSIQIVDPSESNAIASNNLTDINNLIAVNGVQLDEHSILNEMQHHTAESQRDAMIQASESLIIAELLKQRSQHLGLDVSEENEEAYLESLLDSDIEIPTASEADCKHYYEANKNKFITSPLLAVKHILIAADPEDTNARIEAVDTAKQMITELEKNPAAFEIMVEQYSKCPSAKTGGQLGQISRGQTVPEFERQLFACGEGLINVPIESRYGVHIAVIDKRVEGKQLEYSMVEDRIKDYLNEKVRRKAIAQYIECLIAQAEIKGFDFSVSTSPLMQ